MSNANLIMFLETQGYSDLRELPDGTVAGMIRLMFTKAIVLGLDKTGWEYRYCYEDAGRANHEFAKIKSVDDVPAGWVARRYGSGGAS